MGQSGVGSKSTTGGADWRIYERKPKKRFSLICRLLVRYSFLAYFGLKFTFQLFWPFLAGLFLAFLLHPAVNWISRFPLLKKAFGQWRFFFFYILYLAFSLVLCCLALTGIQNLLEFLPRVYREQIEPFLLLLSEHFSPPGARAAASAQNSGELIGQIQKTLVEYSGKALSIISSWIAKAPAAFTTCFFCGALLFHDFDGVPEYLPLDSAQYAPSVHRMLLDLKRLHFFHPIPNAESLHHPFYHHFLELTLGLWILKVENFLVHGSFGSSGGRFAYCRAGYRSGSVGCYLLYQRQLFPGIGLLALFGIVSLIRTIIEPKIIGKQFGLHPLATITAMYAGAQLWGIWGLFLGAGDRSLLLALEGKAKLEFLV